MGTTTSGAEDRIFHAQVDGRIICDRAFPVDSKVRDSVEGAKEATCEKCKKKLNGASSDQGHE